jgi:hypothetical protein
MKHSIMRDGARAVHMHVIAQRYINTHDRTRQNHDASPDHYPVGQQRGWMNDPAEARALAGCIRSQTSSQIGCANRTDGFGVGGLGLKPLETAENRTPVHQRACWGEGRIDDEPDRLDACTGAS